jgi:hypothetical protein
MSHIHGIGSTFVVLQYFQLHIIDITLQVQIIPIVPYAIDLIKDDTIVSNMFEYKHLLPRNCEQSSYNLPTFFSMPFNKLFSSHSTTFILDSGHNLAQATSHAIGYCIGIISTISSAYDLTFITIWPVNHRRPIKRHHRSMNQSSIRPDICPSPSHNHSPC